MNTISSVRPYVNLRNNPQPSTTQQPIAPAFKGQIGKRVVEEIAYKKPLTIASILAMVGGVIGLSKDKVSDVLDSLVARIKGLQAENENLTQHLKQVEIKAAQEKEATKLKFENEKQQMEAGYVDALQELQLEIKEKDAKIAELQKYKAMAKVKSVEELDIVTPEQFLEILEEAKVAQPKAEASLLNYLFNGNGQEEFLAQIERSNQILRAKKDGVTNLEDVKNAYDNVGIIIGYDSAYVAQEMMKKVLKNDEKGVQLSYPPVRVQVEKNADAIINSLMNSQYNNTSNKEILDKVVEFYTNLSSQAKRFESVTGYKFESRKLDRAGYPYYTFTHEDGRKIDIYLTHLAYGNFGISRLTKADGSIQDYSGCYTNL